VAIKGLLVLVQTVLIGQTGLWAQDREIKGPCKNLSFNRLGLFSLKLHYLMVRSLSLFSCVFVQIYFKHSAILGTWPGLLFKAESILTIHPLFVLSLSMFLILVYQQNSISHGAGFENVAVEKFERLKRPNLGRTHPTFNKLALTR